MKKLFLYTLLLFPLFATAQYLEVTPEGLRAKDSKNSYVVLKFKDKTASELYDKAVLYINEKYKSPEHVIKSDIKDVKLRFIQRTTMRVNNSGAKIPVDIEFQNELSFKDGKIKYEITDLDMGGLTFSGSIWKGYPIWNEKNGKLRLEAEKNELENYFNGQIKEFDLYVKNETEDW